MILNYEFHKNPKTNESETIVFIHGLFGNLSNLGMLARAFLETHHVVQIDVRNHGKSEHSSEMNYVLMAQDVLETLDHLAVHNFNVVGHSMGGKIAMKLADFAKDRLQKLIVLDMTPFAYQESHHDSVFKALMAVENAHISSRQEALVIMREILSEEMVIQFLMKSFNKGKFLFNVNTLYEHYSEILAWENICCETSALFIRGGASPYLKKDIHVEAVQQQFPNAKIETVDGAGHWLHAEKTAEVLVLIKSFLN
ncbi:alpha/beta fold hydrolase [Acinetobacter portensis]|uniref:alpha/beta fold hydrolase n=1 Tax=Acinetobacter portensis TaxID=1839785 RepID=UPI0013D670C5|nr:alpha/beta fold hydrolase [Acinetobacter portensis]